jgi:hypothetical protein
VGTGFAYRWWQRDSDRAEGETGGEPRGRANDEALANLAEGERTYPVTAQWAIDHLPASALIWSSGMSGALYYYTQFPIVRFDFINRDRVSDFFRAATTAQRPMYAVLWPHEIDELGRNDGTHETH